MIKVKKCKCGCNKYPTIGYGGYYAYHAPEEIRRKKEERVKKYEARKEKEKPNTTGMWRWFQKIRSRLSGVCQNCGKKTQKNNDVFFMWNIAHILPKNDFDSVAQDDDNFLELCIDCHTKYDRNWMTAQEMPVFKLALEKFDTFKDKIAEKEKRKIPDCFTSKTIT